MFQELKIQRREAWIGLQSVSVVGDWQWSQPGLDKTSAKWAKGEPNGNNDDNFNNCALISTNGLHDTHCSTERTFFCYNGEDILLLFYKHFLFNIHYLCMQ